MLFQADLTVPGSFGEAVRGATYVFHTASPFMMNVPHGAERKLLIEPAVRGTENVIGAWSARFLLCLRFSLGFRFDVGPWPFNT